MPLPLGVFIYPIRIKALKQECFYSIDLLVNPPVTSGYSKVTLLVTARIDIG